MSSDFCSLSTGESILSFATGKKLKKYILEISGNRLDVLLTVHL